MRGIDGAITRAIFVLRRKEDTLQAAAVLYLLALFNWGTTEMTFERCSVFFNRRRLFLVNFIFHVLKYVVACVHACYNAFKEYHNSCFILIIRICY